MKNKSSLCSALLALAGAVCAVPAFATGNCANGQTLYAAPVSGLACASSSCHKANPALGTNKILNGANNPTKIATAINTGIPEMAIFKGKFTASDLDDLATWIAAAPTCPAGGTAVVGASPASFAFAAQTVGTTGAATTVTVSNTGTAAATGVAVANSNATEFPSTNTCSATLANGASCTISVSFAPSAAGSRSATLTISSSAGTSTVGLSGTGNPAATPGVLSLPGPFAFAAQTVATAGAAHAFSLTNTGGTAVTISSVASSNAAEFAVSGSTCAGSIAPAASCTFNVTFTPSATGARSASISVTSSGTGSPQAISVTGTGNAAATPGALSVPGAFGFGATQTVGAASAPQMFTLTNTGGSAVTISSVTSSNAAEFAIGASTCTGSIAPATSCTFSVTFTPSAAGARSASITISSTGTGSPQAIALSGTGTLVVTPGVLSVPAAYAFGAQTVGVASGPQAFTLTNTGGTAVAISGVVSSNAAEFQISSSTCTGSIAAGANCMFSLTFTPSAAGGRSTSVSVTSTGTGSPQAIAVTGTGSTTPVPGTLSLPAPFAFADQLVASASAPHAFTLTNIGGAVVTISGVASSNASEFAVGASTCTGAVAAGASCSFSVTFTPSTAGTRSSSITVTSSSAGSPQALAVSGNGTTSTPPPGGTKIVLTEYYHQAFDHYFVTGNPLEVTKLDAGVFTGWTSTGLSFNAYATGTPGTETTCRFFSAAFAPKSSHFYTPLAAECALVKNNPMWTFEGEVFNMGTPAADGTCGAGLVPVYRLYNNGKGAAPNHRYTTIEGVRDQMIANGWVIEGNGPGLAFMCSPQ
jgi:hypothetical protein